MSGILPPVTFPAKIIGLEPGANGAELLLAYLAKPTNPKASATKLQNWRLWHTPGASTQQRRSRKQVEAGVLDIWRQLRDAVEIGERYSKMAAFYEGGWKEDKRQEKVADWVAPVGQSDLTKWKNWLPLAHVAAGFREVLFRNAMATAFDLQKSEPDRIRTVHHLLIDNHDWVESVAEQGNAWLAYGRLHARAQSPGRTLLFVMRPAGLPEIQFAKTDPHTLN